MADSKELQCTSCRDPCYDPVFCTQCKGYFHYACANVQEGVFRKWNTEMKNKWKCSIACRHAARAQNVSSPPPKSSNDTSLILSVGEPKPKEPKKTPSPVEKAKPASLLSSDLANLKASNMPDKEKMARIFKFMEDIVESIEFQSCKYDEVIRTVAEQNDKIQTQGKKMLEFEQEIKHLRKENDKLSKLVYNVEQQSRKKNLEIHGIQQREGENLKLLVQDLAHQLHLPFEENDIEVVHRVPQNNPKKRNPIMLQLSSQKRRNEWLKKRKTGLVSSNIVSGSDSQHIYVNVSLSPRYKELFWKTRQAQKELMYKYCWLGEGGDIFLQRNSESKRILIRCEEDIPLPGR